MDCFKIFIDPLIANWPLVAVGIVASYLALRTLNEIQRQTSATEKAALAAQASAESLISSERAWVLVENATVRSDPRPNMFAIFPTIKNYGKTMARITQFSGSIMILESTENLPREVKYGHVQILNYFLYPNATFEPVEFAIQNDQLHNVRTGLFNVWLFGAIEYLDLSNSKRITRFCITYEHRGDEKLQLSGTFYPVIARDILLKYTECT